MLLGEVLHLDLDRARLAAASPAAPARRELDREARGRRCRRASSPPPRRTRRARAPQPRPSRCRAGASCTALRAARGSRIFLIRILRHARSSAPKRSTSAATILSRAASASSSVSVRSGAWKTRCSGDGLPSLPHLVAAVDVEDARLAELGATRLVGGGDDSAGLDVLGDGDGDVLPVRRVRDDVLVEDPLRHRGHQPRRRRARRRPTAVEQRRVELAEPACVRLGRLAGVEVVEWSPGAPRAGGGTPREIASTAARAASKPPSAMPADAPPLSGSCSPDGR